MDAKSSKGKQTLEEKMNKHGIIEEDVDDDLEEEEGTGVELSFVDEDKKKKGNVVYAGRSRGSSGGNGGGGVSPPCCQAEKCGADMRDAKRYHRRHKVCEFHAKAPIVIVAGQPGLWQRFCQQCSRFHELSEFDEAKRSCRRRLAGHNERRRKSAAEYYGEASSRKGASNQLKESPCTQADERGRVQITLSRNSTYKHYQIK